LLTEARHLEQCYDALCPCPWVPSLWWPFFQGGPVGRGRGFGAETVVGGAGDGRAIIGDDAAACWAVLLTVRAGVGGGNPVFGFVGNSVDCVGFAWNG